MQSGSSSRDWLPALPVSEIYRLLKIRRRIFNDLDRMGPNRNLHHLLKEPSYLSAYANEFLDVYLDDAEGYGSPWIPGGVRKSNDRSWNGPWIHCLRTVSRR